MNINKITKIQNNNIAFNGLTKKMKKQTYIDGQKDIKEILDERVARGDKSFIVGKLPGRIFDRLPKEGRVEAIMDIYNVFDEVAEELRNFDETKVYGIKEISQRRNNSTVKKLEDILIKYNVISKWDDFDLEYLGKGGKGAVYKLCGIRSTNFDEDEYVIKVFHQIEGDHWHNFKSHGCYAELNSAQYWISTAGYDTNRGKFFWGSFKSGYMINKYVDEDVRLPRRIVNPYRYGLKTTDEDALKKHNVCKGYSYDWGGVRVINRIKNGNKYARKISEVIKNTPEQYREAKWHELLYKKDANPINKNAGLAMSIKHLKDKPKHIDICLKLNKTLVNRGLAYVLKYLPYETALQYFEKLVQTKDVITQVILFNEIPLLAMKHRDKEIKDDLQTVRSEIVCNRIARYYDIAEKYALPESIEHLASFVHLLPREDFKGYYKRLAAIDNEALQDRLLYKFHNVPLEDKAYALRRLAEIVTNKRLINEIYQHAKSLSPKELGSVIEKIFIKNIQYRHIDQIMKIITKV